MQQNFNKPTFKKKSLLTLVFQTNLFGNPSSGKKEIQALVVIEGFHSSEMGGGGACRHVLSKPEVSRDLECC